MRLALGLKYVLTAVLCLFVLVGAGLFLVGTETEERSSVEVAVSEMSPRGIEGGAVIPASCPSYAHATGQCTPPTFTVSYLGDGGSGGSGDGGSSITINEGDAVELEWACSSDHNTDSSGLNFSTGGALSGTEEVTPADDATYSITCNDSGTTADVEVTVLHPSLSLSASPTRVRAGNASTITWSASEVDSCSVTGPAGAFASGTSGSQSTGAISNQSVYTLTCQTEGGAVSASVTVTIAPSFEEI
jgi:hypothetical protein